MIKYKTKSDFPFIQQTGMMECGTTCLAMIFKYYGFYNVQRVLAQMAEVTTEGVDLYTLSEISESFGFETDAYELEYEYLLKVTHPCIVHFDGNHFVVVYKVTDDHVWVADPAYGKDKYSKDEFVKRWNGITLVMKPTSSTFQDKDLLDHVETVRQKNKSIGKKFYWPVINPYKRVVIEVLLATLCLQIMGLAIPFFTEAIVDNVLVNKNKELLFAILGAMFIIFVGQVALLYVRNILLIQLKLNLEHDFFGRFFAHFIALFQRFYDNHKREDFINRFRENLKIRQMANPYLLQSAVDVIFVLGYLPILMLYNMKLGLMATIFTVLYILVAVAITPRLKQLANKVFYKDTDVLGRFLDALLGIRSVKLLGVERIKFFKWKNEYKRNLNAVLASEKAEVGLVTTQRSLYFFAQICVFWIGAYLVFQDQLTLGQYLAFITIFMIVLNALNNISGLWIELTNLSVSMARLNDVLVQDSEYTNELNRSSINQVGNLVFKNVSFKYQSREEDYVLRNIDLTIKEGEKVGIVGRNGAGKSTLVKLLVNFYPQYEGQILADNGKDLRSYKLRELRKKIFLFPQDIYLFDASIRENILYAKPEASIEELVQAAKLADIHDFVKSLYLGYNHKIGEFGANLSGGQKLKIGFARLFLSEAEVIILDEASSQLDIETEKKILDNIHHHFEGKTIISIAHRISTLKKSDRILVIDEGSLAEQGTHMELLEKQGLYYQFVNTYVNF